MLSKKKIQFIRLMLTVLASATVMFATTTEVFAAGAAYSISKVPVGADEIDSKASYYDLKLKAGQKKTIQADIRNTGTKEIVVKNEIFAAFTNANGEIDYTKQAESYDASLKVKMNDIAKVKASDINATIPAGKKRTVSVDIEMPKEVQTGVILGSWHFEEVAKDDENKKSSGVTIDSKYAYALAIKITVDKEISKPNLNLLGVTTGLLNYKKAFLAEIQNDQPALLTRVKIEGNVTDKGKFETLYSNTMESVSFAPNSKYQFPVYLNQDQLRAGEYTYRIKAVTQDPKNGFTGQKWEWNLDFTVLPEQAEKVNKEAINDGKAAPTFLDYVKAYWWAIALGVVVIIGFIFLLFFLLGKRRKKKDDTDENVEMEVGALETIRRIEETKRRAAERAERRKRNSEA
ncbi:protein of unknown function [Pilibacter termitis]|uniref:Uncharacterized protein n=1 Tax=Pilibacter termitis TaxID=263852 RepID=A0A1T4KC45_9ENTE|nr:DUF916 and DUF3324 domain-containing protein [Pilibacter termitis]SJZ40024.1 protein of unknown function [Pilibacter termitis]